MGYPTGSSDGPGQSIERLGRDAGLERAEVEAYLVSTYAIAERTISTDDLSR
jgi:hypothetical protein